MNARVNVIAKSEEDALVVPASAVYTSEEAGEFVMVAGTDKKAHLTKVKVGIKNKELAQIESGLKENESGDHRGRLCAARRDADPDRSRAARREGKRRRGGG